MLDLSKNKIPNIEVTVTALNLHESIFASLRHLKEIDLSSNLLTEFPIGLSKCVKLREVRLIHNGIKTIPLEFYESQTIQNSLEYLILNNNPLQELAAEISRLKYLKTLGIASSKVTKLPN